MYKNSKFFLFNVILFFSLQDRAGQDVQMDEPPIMRLWNTFASWANETTQVAQRL